ncbi:MAG: hypothetical protein ACOCV1_05990 [Bacillota bacterium]
MKKILSFILAIMVITLISCSGTNGETTNFTENNSLTTEISSTTEAPVNDYLDLGYEYNMIYYSDPMFDAEITNIKFDVVQRKICFHYQINDYTNAREYYFVYGYEEKTFRPFHRISSYDIASSADYCLDMLYDENYPNDYVTIEMGYYSSSASINKEYPETNSVGFRYRINSIESRSIIEDYSIGFSKDDSDPYHNAKFRLIVEDADYIVSSVKLVISQVFMDNNIVEERTILIDQTMKTETGFTIEPITFTNLLPSERYQVTVYVSGYDGMFPFEDIELGYKQTQMETL